LEDRVAVDVYVGVGVGVAVAVVVVVAVVVAVAVGDVGAVGVAVTEKSEMSPADVLVAALKSAP
jgi:hypothetical protein